MFNIYKCMYVHRTCVLICIFIVKILHYIVKAWQYNFETPKIVSFNEIIVDIFSLVEAHCA